MESKITKKGVTSLSIIVLTILVIAFSYALQNIPSISNSALWQLGGALLFLAFIGISYIAILGFAISCRAESKKRNQQKGFSLTVLIIAIVYVGLPLIISLLAAIPFLLFIGSCMVTGGGPGTACS